MNTIKERPILFKTEMVRAILDGRKTQTRRMLKVQPKDEHVFQGCIANEKLKTATAVFGEDVPLYPTCSLTVKSPFGLVGERLWVRQTFVVGYELDDDCSPMGDEKVWYRATDSLDSWYDIGTDSEINVPWKPSIHMPRWASRVLLEIAGMRVERLNDITRGDCMAEGCPFPNIAKETDPKQWYKETWESINGAGSWEQNPWVWAISFKVVEVKS